MEAVTARIHTEKLPQSVIILAVLNEFSSVRTKGTLIMTRPLTDFDVLSFDCYGTLIDWETGIWDALQPLLMENDCSTLHSEDALELFSQH